MVACVLARFPQRRTSYRLILHCLAELSIMEHRTGAPTGGKMIPNLLIPAHEYSKAIFAVQRQTGISLEKLNLSCSVAPRRSPWVPASEAPVSFRTICVKYRPQHLASRLRPPTWHPYPLSARTHDMTMTSNLSASPRYCTMSKSRSQTQLLLWKTNSVERLGPVLKKRALPSRPISRW